MRITFGRLLARGALALATAASALVGTAALEAPPAHALVANYGIDGCDIDTNGTATCTVIIKQSGLYWFVMNWDADADWAASWIGCNPSGTSFGFYEGTPGPGSAYDRVFLPIGECEMTLQIPVGYATLRLFPV